MFSWTGAISRSVRCLADDQTRISTPRRKQCPTAPRRERRSCQPSPSSCRGYGLARPDYLSALERLYNASDCRNARRLRVAVLILLFAANIEDTAELRNIAKNRRFDGFVKAKCQWRWLLKHGQAVRQDVMGEVMQRHFIEAIAKEKINSLAHLLSHQLNNAGADLVFNATFEVYPGSWAERSVKTSLLRNQQ